MTQITFTKESFKRFKKAYKDAIRNKATQFTFEQNEFIVGYAKYVIEYIEGK